MLTTPFFKILSLYLIVALFALSFPASGWAMLVPADRTAEARSADLARVQTTLESSIIRQRLLDYGLTPEETTERLNALSDEQVQRLAADLDAIQAGGEFGDVIAVLLIIVIIIVVLELAGYHVVMRH